MKAPGSPATPTEPIWRLSVKQYHAMVQAGILVSGDPIELLDGWLVAKVRRTPQRCFATGTLDRLLRSILPDGWFEMAYGAVTTSDSEPEPDLAVVRGPMRRYADHHPGPEDVALVVETTDASLRRDPGVKARIYARAAIAIYWIVNLIDLRVEVYTDPTGPTEQPSYRQRQVFSLTESVPVVIEGCEVGRIPVQDLMP